MAMTDVRIGDMPIANGLYYAKVGSQQTPLVLIHGAASSHLAFPPALRRMKERTVIALDLPGHGRSEGAGLRDVNAYAEAVVGLLDALEYEQCIILGHSMGGAIAQTIAYHHPERVAGMILLSTGARLPVNQSIIEGVLADKLNIATNINRWAWSPDADEALKQKAFEYLMTVPAQVIQDDYIACDAFDLRDKLTEIAIPTLILCGSIDKMTPPKFSKTLNDNLPQANYHLYDGAGHWLPLEQPQWVAQKISDWLAQCNL